MSTRCQVKIHGPKGKEKDAVTLYHHCDGYPTYMLPTIFRGYAPDWKHGRIGKAASFIVAADPEEYEIEEGHALHGDIEWYYTIEVVSEQHVNAIPTWKVTVHKVSFNGEPKPIGRVIICEKMTMKRIEQIANALEEESYAS